MTYSVFCSLRDENIPINGPILKTIALKIAKELKNDSFKASNGWVEKFVKKYGITFKNLTGESKTACVQDAVDFCSKIYEIKNIYGANNVFNCDETALFYKKLSNKSFVASDDNCKGIKQNKNKLTLLLCCSYAGEKLKPLIIGGSKSPRCLKNVDLSLLKIEYDFSKKSWMTKTIFEAWLERRNYDMAEMNRKIVLILDNATCHNISKKFSNIDLIFLPKNTTSLIQPCDQGIIKAFKNKFNNFMTENIIIESNNGTKKLQTVLTEINLLDAICVARLAWDDVTEHTVQNCFIKAFDFNGNITEQKLKANESDASNLHIEEIVTNVVSDNFEEETSDEEDEDSFEDLADLNKSFKKIIQFSKKYSPENLAEFYALKTQILKNYREKTKRKCNLFDFFKKK